MVIVNMEGKKGTATRREKFCKKTIIGKRPEEEDWLGSNGEFAHSKGEKRESANLEIPARISIGKKSRRSMKHGTKTEEGGGEAHRP